MSRSVTVVVTVLLLALAVADVVAGTWAVAVLPLLGLLVAAGRMRGPLPGPDIHDRELDRIVAAGAGIAAGALVIGQLLAPDRALGLLALAPAAAAVIALGAGTRRLWHVRAVPLLLVAAWPVPWRSLPEVPAMQAAVAACIAVAGLLWLVARPGVERRPVV